MGLLVPMILPMLVLHKVRTRNSRLVQVGFLLLGTTLVGVAPVIGGEAGRPHAGTDRSGVVLTTENQTLRLRADMGSVQIQTAPQGGTPTVRYSAHIETDANMAFAQKFLESYLLTAIATPSGVEIIGNLAANQTPDGRRPQLWVQYVVTVPASYSVEVFTGAGDIQTSDIGGHAYLQTEGGNITTGRIGMSPYHMPADRPAAKLETQGGHIRMLDVAGTVDAFTAGGHITAGNIEGSAKLRTGGGHIRAGQIKGTATLETDGGNVTVGEAGAFVTVRTGGGQIDFGEVHGSVHAQTGGGGIRAMYVAGPMEVEARNGSICMTKVTNTVHAETGEGTITAWINPEALNGQNPVRLPGPSQLASQSGNIVVYLPRNLAVTIEASVENGGLQRIEADPSLALNVQTRHDGQVHALGILNGGGATLKLRTTTGRIQLHYIDTDVNLRNSLMLEQKIRLAQALSHAGTDQQVTISALPQRAQGPADSIDGKEGDWWDSLTNRLQITFLGGMREDPDEFKKRLTSMPLPDYPVVARKAGIQGVVKLQVRLKADGSLTVERVMEGEPALVEAATAAIEKWRATPGEWGGKKVDVISVVTFNFQPR